MKRCDPINALLNSRLGDLIKLRELITLDQRAALRAKGLLVNPASYLDVIEILNTNKT